MPLACGIAFRAGGHDIERVDVSEPASISSGIAARYAAAVFELAKDEGALPALEKDMDALGAAWSESADLRDLATSPVYAREEQQKAIAAIAAKMGLSALTANTLALMGSKRRLFVLPQMVADVQNRIATEKGEITAEVTAAAPLSPEQAARLAATLKARAGKDVKLKTTVDESLIGGLVVKLGSSMIDTSVKARLAALQNAMKEVG
ncbi:ATP synthase F1 subcomplex delta subunit [Cereibacter johrii]|uniref:ATP synthase subunit delta n=1 Tax=Cereibacter johrii TaxID=445629 RepID=A0ABX5JCY0_9RHOB|nr:ATP synthase F1 subcomplex delta subunit [Cereibacter johrii]